MKQIVILPICLYIFFFFTSPVFAVSVTVTDIPSTISANPFTLTVSVYGANSGKNYLRVDLFKDGTFNYFGETYNGSEWYFGSAGTSYFPIDIVSSSSTASASVQAQIGEPSATDFSGSGAYKLRIRRYTSASSYSAGSSYDVVINVPTPTSTPTPTPTPANTSTPTPSPTQTPGPTNTPTSTPQPIKTPTPTPIESSPTPTGIRSTPISASNELFAFGSGSGDVLSSSTASGNTISDTEKQKKSFKPLIFSLLFIGIGCGLLVFVYYFKKGIS